jgi:hypothetical protein
MTNEKLPSTLAEIRAIASRVFEDSKAVSVNIQTAWGMLVTVTRDLEIREAAAE